MQLRSYDLNQGIQEKEIHVHHNHLMSNAQCPITIPIHPFLIFQLQARL